MLVLVDLDVVGAEVEVVEAGVLVRHRHDEEVPLAFGALVGGEEVASAFDVLDAHESVVLTAEDDAVAVHVHRETIARLLLDLVGVVLPHRDEVLPLDVSRSGMAEDGLLRLLRVIAHDASWVLWGNQPGGSATEVAASRRASTRVRAVDQRIAVPAVAHITESVHSRK